MVTLGISVTDKQGRPISGLRPEDFEIIEDKTPQKIELFATEDSPLTIAIAIDRSGSMMINHKLERALEAVTMFLNQSNPDDEFLLGVFNQRLNVVQDFAPGPKPALEAVKRCEAPDGGTSLYDSIFELVDRINHFNTEHHKAIVLLTDGDDRSSTHTIEQTIKYASQGDVQIYTIGIFGDDYSATARGFLKKISDDSGGRSYFPAKEKEMPKIWSEIAGELRHQYGIAYSPSNNRWDGNWRNINVKVKKQDGMPKIKLHTRRGYFASIPGSERGPVVKNENKQ